MTATCCRCRLVLTVAVSWTAWICTRCGERNTWASVDEIERDEHDWIQVTAQDADKKYWEGE